MALNSCSPPPVGQGALPGAVVAPPPPITRTRPKTPDPVKAQNCSRMKQGRACEQDENCKEICDDIFSSRNDRKKCYEFSEDLVSSFKELLESTEDGDVEDIDSLVLECLLDIDEREFAKAVKGMSRKNAKDFLIAIANDEALADVLEDEDDEFNILKQLLNKATGSNDLLPQLKKEIESNKSFLYLSAEGAESVWKWLDSYVESACGSSTCPDGDNISAYCQALLDLSDKNLEDFLSDGDRFAEEYEKDVENDNYSYSASGNVRDKSDGDFKAWCRIQTGVKQACPASGSHLPFSQRLAELRLDNPIYNDDLKAYVPKGGYCHGRGSEASILRDPLGVGSSSPKQNLLLHFSNWPELHLNNDILDFDPDSADYFIYIDNTRYSFGPGDAAYDDDCSESPNSGVNMIRYDESDGLNNKIFDGKTRVSIWIASEKDGECSYYTDN